LLTRCSRPDYAATDFALMRAAVVRYSHHKQNTGAASLAYQRLRGECNDLPHLSCRIGQHFSLEMAR
jgi:hypothetical protein